MGTNPCNMLEGLTGRDLITHNYDSIGCTPYFVDPLTSMDTSLFDCDTCGTFSMAGGYPGMYYGLNGAEFGSYQPYSYDPTNYMQQWRDYYRNQQKQDLQHQKEMKLAERQANADVKKGEDKIREAVTSLQTRIAADDQENIPKALEHLKDMVKEYYPNGENMTESDINAAAGSLYLDITKENIKNDILKNGSSTFWSKFKHSISFGLLNSSNCAEETVANLENRSLSKEEKAHAFMGSVAGSAALGVGVGIGTKPALKALGLMRKGSKGGFWGLVIGAVAGIASYIISNKETSIDIPSVNMSSLNLYGNKA